jgi:DNA-directed RNA polymerase subunit beta'
VTSREGEIVMLTKEGAIRSRLAVPYGATLTVEDEQQIAAGDLLFSWDPYSEPIVADHPGRSASSTSSRTRRSARSSTSRPAAASS